MNQMGMVNFNGYSNGSAYPNGGLNGNYNGGLNRFPYAYQQPYSNGYQNAFPYPYQQSYQNAFPYPYPVTPPTRYPVFNREDNYQPPVGLHIDWGNMSAQLAIDNRTTIWLADQINQGANAGAIAAGLVGLGVITAPEAAAVAVISGILKVGAGAITSTNTFGGNKGVYFDIPWYVIFPVGTLAAIPALSPKPRS